MSTGAAVTILVVCVLGAVLLAVVRLVRGPTWSDRVIAQDVLFAAAVVACVAASLATARTVFLDVGIGLALTGFVATMAWEALFAGNRVIEG